MIRTQQILLIILLGFISAACTQPQMSQGQASRIAVLEQRVVALEQQRQKSLADLRAETARLLKRVEKEIENFRKSQRFFIEELDTLKRDAALITNENEKAGSAIRRNTVRIQRMVKRLGDQVLALEELKKFFASSVDTSDDITPEEKTAFDKVFRQYRKKNFKVALRGFEEFRKNHPESILTQDSMFFIAYIHFLIGQYDTATLRFFELIEQYPGTKRINDAKWWLGISLERTGDINGALDLYRELSKLDDQNPLKIKASFRLAELESNAPSE